MDDQKLLRRGFLGKLATALAGLATVPLLASPALADRPYRRRGWGWTGRRWGQTTVRRWRPRNYGYPAYRTPANVPGGYNYPAPRGGFPLRTGPGWGGPPGYFPPMLNRSPLRYANPLSRLES